AYAAEIKENVAIPVIAVGRLGDPDVATDAVASGKADFVALGRTLIAEPDWVMKLSRGEPARRCLACNTCINEMRGGSQLPCVRKGVTFRYGIDIAHAPGELASFDRIVIATGARYRFGLGPLPGLLLDRGAGHWPGLERIFKMPAFRNWFYDRARRATGDDF